MKQKRFWVLLLCGFMLFSVKATPVQAIEDQPAEVQKILKKLPGGGDASVMYTDTKLFSARTSTSGTTVMAEMSVSTRNGNVKTSGTIYLDKFNGRSWENVAGWSVSGQGSFSVLKTYNGVSGRRYRSRIKVRVGSDNINYTTNEATTN